MNVVAVGDNCVDYYPKLERWYPTGNCVDFAVNISSLGVETAIVSLTGNDVYGDSIAALLKDKHVESSHLHRCDGKTAVATMDLVGEDGKDRLHASFDDGVLASFDLSEEDLAYISKFDIVHSLIHSFINRHIPAIKAMGKTIVYDFSTAWDHPEAALVTPYTDYGFFSYGKEDDYILEYLVERCRLGMGVAIATLGDKGSIAFDGHDFHRSGCAPISELVNTVGAGDSYIAGFTYGLTQGMDIEGCMRSGAELAAKIVQVFEPYEDYGPEKITGKIS